jgi:hypothetical protein
MSVVNMHTSTHTARKDFEERDADEVLFGITRERKVVKCTVVRNIQIVISMRSKELKLTACCITTSKATNSPFQKPDELMFLALLKSSWQGCIIGAGRK